MPKKTNSNLPIKKLVHLHSEQGLYTFFNG
jgi:hypothetical protein